MGVAEISLGDTIGVGVPTQVEYLLEALLKDTMLKILPCIFMTHVGQH